MPKFYTELNYKFVIEILSCVGICVQQVCVLGWESNYSARIPKTQVLLLYIFGLEFQLGHLLIVGLRPGTYPC